MDSYDLDLVFSNAVNEAIVAENDLSDVLDVQFWHDSPRARIVYEAIRSAEDAISEHSRNLRCIASDEEADIDSRSSRACSVHFT